MEFGVAVVGRSLSLAGGAARLLIDLGEDRLALVREFFRRRDDALALEYFYL